MNETDPIKLAQQENSSNQVVGVLSSGMASFGLSEVTPSFYAVNDYLAADKMLLVTASSVLVFTCITRPLIKRFTFSIASLYCALIVANLLPFLHPSLLITLISRILVGFSFGLFFSVAVDSIKSTLDPKQEPTAFWGIFLSFFIFNALGIALSSWITNLSAYFIMAFVPTVVNLVLQFLGPLPIATKPDRHNIRKWQWFSRNRKATGLLLLVLSPCFTIVIYLRLFILDIGVVRFDAIVPIILSFGITQFIGILLSRSFLQNNFYSLIVLLPVVTGGLLIGLLLFRNSPWIVYLFVVVVGFLIGVLCIGWSLWFTKGFSVSSVEVFFVAIQLAVVLAVCLGMCGTIFKGIVGVFVSSVVVLMAVPLWVLCLRVVKS